jgi:hypothetical protein
MKIYCDMVDDFTTTTAKPIINHRPTVIGFKFKIYVDIFYVNTKLPTPKMAVHP